MSIIGSKDSDGVLNVLACGKVTRDAETRQNSHGTKIKFTVAYGKKKYMDCEAWADSPVGQTAACLEAGDIIGVSGTMRSWEYNDKTYTSVDADMIFLLVRSGAEAATPSVPAPKTTSFAELDDESEDDLPF